jgi:hypothetical protein
LKKKLKKEEAPLPPSLHLLSPPSSLSLMSTSEQGWWPQCPALLGMLWATKPGWTLLPFLSLATWPWASHCSSGRQGGILADCSPSWAAGRTNMIFGKHCVNPGPQKVLNRPVLAGDFQCEGETAHKQLQWG